MALTVTDNYQAVHDRLQRTTVYKVTFARSGQVCSTHKLGDADVCLQIPRGFSSEVTPGMGTSSIGSTVIVLDDHDGNATDLIGQGIGGDTVTIHAGFADIDEADFVELPGGTVESFRLTNNLAAYEIVIRYPQSLTNKQVFDVSATALTAALAQAAADTWLHVVTLGSNLGGSLTTTNTKNSAAMTTALTAEYGAGNYTLVSSTAVVGSTITVTDTTFFRSAGYLIIDKEIIAYTGKTATTFTGLTRASLSTLAALHASGTAVQEMLRLGPAHPMDLIQAIYTDTDKGGLGIAAAFVNADAFATAKWIIGSGYQMEFRITERVNAKDFIEQELFRTTSSYSVVRGGKLSVVVLAEPTDASSVADIDHDSILADDGQIAMTWDGNFASLANHVTVLYDEDVTSKEFASSYEDSDATSIATYGKKPVVIEARGFRTSLANTAMMIAERVTAYLDRYKNAAPIVTVQTHLRNNLIEAGDIVSLTSSKLPNRATKVRGVTDALFEAIRTEVQFPAVGLTLLWTSFSGLSSDNFDRASSVASAWDLGNDWIKSESGPGVMRVVSY